MREIFARRDTQYFLLVSAMAAFVLLLIFPVVKSKAFVNFGFLALTRAMVGADIPVQSIPSPQSIIAERWLRRATSADAMNRTAWRGLGFALLMQNRNDDAVKSLQNVPGIVYELIFWGKYAQYLKQYEMALNIYDLASKITPKNGYPLYYLGLMYEEQGQWQKAYEVFAGLEAQKKENIESSIYFHIGWILQAHMTPPDLPGALQSFNNALAYDNFIQEEERINTHLYLGDNYRIQGNNIQAIQEYKWVIAHSPNNYWAYVWLGVMNWSVYGNQNNAKSNLTHAIALKPDNKWAYQMLGKIYWEFGDITDARKMFVKVLQLDPNDHVAQSFFASMGK